MFKHIPRPVIALVLDAARTVRKGAKVRIAVGDRISDDMFVDCIHDAASDLSLAIFDATAMRVPPSALRPLLWRAARVGEAASCAA